MLTIILVILVVLQLANLAVAAYGRDKGWPFFPLLVASCFLGFPLVLLVVTIAGARKEVEE